MAMDFEKKGKLIRSRPKRPDLEIVGEGQTSFSVCSLMYINAAQ